MDVLEFYLSLESHQSRLSTDIGQRFYYVPQDTIRKLKGEFEEDRRLLQQSLAVMDDLERIPFLFLVTPMETESTYFLVMFDYIHEKALILGRKGLHGPDFHKDFAEWESWNGLALWRKIYASLIRPGSEDLEREPTFYETDLILVTNSMQSMYKPKLTSFLARLSFRPGYLRVCAASPGLQMELGPVYILSNNA